MGGFIQSVITGMELAERRRQREIAERQQAADNLFRQEQADRQVQQFNTQQQFARDQFNVAESARKAQERFQAASAIAQGLFSPTSTTPQRIPTDTSFVEEGLSPTSVGQVDVPVGPGGGFEYGGTTLFPTAPDHRARIAQQLALEGKEAELDIISKAESKRRREMANELMANPYFKKLPEKIRGQISLSAISGMPLDLDRSEYGKMVHDYWNDPSLPPDERQNLWKAISHIDNQVLNRARISASALNPMTQINTAAHRFASRAIYKADSDLPQGNDTERMALALTHLNEIAGEDSDAIAAARQEIRQSYNKADLGLVETLVANARKEQGRTPQPTNPAPQSAPAPAPTPTPTPTPTNPINPPISTQQPINPSNPFVGRPGPDPFQEFWNAIGGAADAIATYESPTMKEVRQRQLKKRQEEINKILQK